MDDRHVIENEDDGSPPPLVVVAQDRERLDWQTVAFQPDFNIARLEVRHWFALAVDRNDVQLEHLSLRGSCGVLRCCWCDNQASQGGEEESRSHGVLLHAV